jgi:hypothetical protein
MSAERYGAYPQLRLAAAAPSCLVFLGKSQFTSGRPFGRSLGGKGDSRLRTSMVGRVEIVFEESFKVDHGLPAFQTGRRTIDLLSPSESRPQKRSACLVARSGRCPSCTMRREPSSVFRSAIAAGTRTLPLRPPGSTQKRPPPSRRTSVSRSVKMPG